MSDLVRMRCPICGVIYGLEKEYSLYRLRGGQRNGKKANWFCPNGDSLEYLDDTIAEFQARELDEENGDDAEKLAEESGENVVAFRLPPKAS